ncbi:hypothetical protein EXU57_08770 [Segetibacter sp. 3557_3]|uniref:hypothetical protein n=1 Tax=Segetibacter sp. 3557_3 TaxID=2547429 RepID=UPI001058E4EC|nr:hypothetical protein [Segetibacter sp. 3557_3]TDH26888.1 hypothetical protein EXU57_08770 [Segetibacter sp. 3557_3]
MTSDLLAFTTLQQWIASCLAITGTLVAPKVIWQTNMLSPKQHFVDFRPANNYNFTTMDCFVPRNDGNVGCSEGDTANKYAFTNQRFVDFGPANDHNATARDCFVRRNDGKVRALQKKFEQAAPCNI